MSVLTESLGLAAGILTTFSFLPQVIKIWRTRDVRAISLMMYSTFCLGAFFWLLFGIAIGSIAIILANSITLLCSASILYLKITIEW